MQEYDIAWNERAGQQFKRIFEDIKYYYSEKAAIKFRNTVRSRIEKIRTLPELFPREIVLLDCEENYRSFHVNHYKVIYEFTGKEIIIVMIYSMKRSIDFSKEDLI